MTSFKFCLAFFVGLFVLSATNSVPAADQQYAAVLTVKNMCCAKESVPAIKELSKVPGVGRIFVDYKTRTLMIAPTKVTPSPLAILEAAERVKIAPVRLATPGEVHTSKPRR